MTYSAFSGFSHIASGALAEVYGACRNLPGSLIFDQDTGRLVEIDPRHPPTEEAARPGRPRLGVVAREVTLLPRHWEWLGRQPGGASAALRRIVEQARRLNSSEENIRAAREALYRFMTAMAGDAVGYEEAIRALFAGDAARFSA